MEACSTAPEIHKEKKVVCGVLDGDTVTAGRSQEHGGVQHSARNPQGKLCVECSTGRPWQTVSESAQVLRQA